MVDCCHVSVCSISTILQFFFSGYCDHRDIHVLTHSFPTRRSSDLFDAHHRFVVEAPMRGRTPGEHVRDDGERVVEVVDDGDVEPGRPASPWRLPWLLLAALVIAGLLSALLLFGSG